MGLQLAGRSSQVKSANGPFVQVVWGCSIVAAGAAAAAAAQLGPQWVESVAAVLGLMLIGMPRCRDC